MAVSRTAEVVEAATAAAMAVTAISNLAAAAAEVAEVVAAGPTTRTHTLRSETSEESLVQKRVSWNEGHTSAAGSITRVPS